MPIVPIVPDARGSVGHLDAVGGGPVELHQLQRCLIHYCAKVEAHHHLHIGLRGGVQTTGDARIGGAVPGDGPCGSGGCL